jgi:hypothetical protein
MTAWGLAAGGRTSGRNIAAIEPIESMNDYEATVDTICGGGSGKVTHINPRSPSFLIDRVKMQLLRQQILVLSALAGVCHHS